MEHDRRISDVSNAKRLMAVLITWAALAGASPVAAQQTEASAAWGTTRTTPAGKWPKGVKEPQRPALQRPALQRPVAQLTPQPVAHAGKSASDPPESRSNGLPNGQQNGMGIMFADWHLTCEPAGSKQVCALSQTVRDALNRRIIQMTARRTDAAAYLEILVPYGISIPYGVALNLADEVVLPAPLADCDQTGCRAVLGLDGETLKQLKAAKALAIAFQDSKSGKVISIGGSPKGFEPGIAMLFAAP